MLGMVALAYFEPNPLPDQVGRVAYGLDHVWNLSLAGEVKHHWPVTDPSVSGTALPYHLFASVDLAAISQVTGLDLAVVFFRLSLVPLLLVFIVELAWAGVVVSRRAWAGPVAAALVLFAGEIDIAPQIGRSFGNELTDTVLGLSPSFLLGAVFFVPALVLLYEGCQAMSVNGDWRRWMIVGLLFCGCAGAKATILPLVIVALGLYVAWRWLTSRERATHSLIALALAIVLYLGAYIVIYGAAGSYGLDLHVPGAVRQMFTIEHVAGLIHGQPLLAIPFWAAAIPVGLAGAYAAPLIGAVWSFGMRGAAVAPGHLLLVAVFIAGLGPFLLFTHFGLSQVFFAQYGLIAGCLLAADGLCLLGSALAPQLHGARPRPARLLPWLVASLVVAAILLAVLRPSADYYSSDYYSYIHLALAAAAATFALMAWRSRRESRTSTLYPLSVLLTLAALNTPLDVLAPAIRRAARNEPPYGTTGHGLTPGLLQGLHWLRARTRSDDVVAVSNYSSRSIDQGFGQRVPDDYYYSAFAERRVFLEGWVYAQRAFKLGEQQVFAGIKRPFPKRMALNEAVFRHANPRALRTLADHYHVRYLLVDNPHRRATHQLHTIAHPAYHNSDVTIYKVPWKRPTAPRPKLLLTGH